MNSARVQEIRSIYKNQFHFYTLAMNIPKLQLPQENEHICPHKNLFIGMDQQWGIGQHTGYHIVMKLFYILTLCE